VSVKTVSEDHIIALIKGGSDLIDNITPSCRTCNIRKNARSVEEYKMYLGKVESCERRLDIMAKESA